MKIILNLFTAFFLLINPICSQQYQFNQALLKSLESGTLNPRDVENLTIAEQGTNRSFLLASSNPKASLENLKKLKQLKVLQFKNLRLIFPEDTFFNFASKISDLIVHVTPYGLDLSPYNILPLLDAFEELEILELDFLDNDEFYKICNRDFGWAVLCEKIEQEMILELFDCRRSDSPRSYETIQLERFSMWSWHQIEGEELGVLSNTINLRKTVHEKEMETYSYRIEENPWEFEEGLSDEEYCERMPDFCDDSGPFFDMNDENHEIDTAFLKILGDWPLKEKEEVVKIIDHCSVQLQGNPIWKTYQAKCAELGELYWIEKEGIEGVYQKLSAASQALVEARKDLTLPVLQQASQRSLLIQQFYYKELWETLRPWNVKTRSELFLEQLGNLKKLRKLSISNNYMLDFEELIDFIAKELPNLEVLEFSACKLYNIPANINQLKHLTTLNLNDNFIHNASIIQLPNLAILSLKGNQIVEEDVRILKKILPSCSLRF
jgi:Leucine-rich repeat (LRR) protein